RSHVLDTALKRLGVQPDLNAGQSVGEWLAGRSAGWVSEETVTKLLGQLDNQSFDIPEVGFLVVGCGYEEVEPMLAEIENIYLSNDNCPQQVILCGTNEALAELRTVLQERQIFHQLLPIRSGFHSPFLKDRMDALSENMRGVRFQRAQVPLWSATTVDVYPDSEEEVLALSVEHLLQPVRFRQLTERLYAEGVRVFIQVGSGGLTGFIDDTLKGREYSAVAANVSARSGLAQLQRVLAALYVEGVEVDGTFLGVERTAGIPLQLGSPLVRGMETLRELAVKKAPVAQKVAVTAVERRFLETVTMMSYTQDEVLSMFRHPGGGDFVHQLNISLATHPYLIDHALVRQRERWPQVRDMDPVIPMTMMLELFGEITQEHSGGRLPRKMKNIKILQWMNVAAPFRETVRGQWQGRDQLSLTLDQYASAEMVLGGSPGESMVLDTGESLGIRLSPEQIYEQHMFHGPAYQGIREVMEMGKQGIKGIIEGGEGKGSLLDNAGQLFGLWLQFVLEKDRIAFPVKISEIEFFGDWRQQTGKFECTCCLTQLNEDFATGEFLIRKEGKVWAVVRGWQNRRLEIDRQFWRVAMSPLHNFLSEEVAPGVFFFHNAYSRMVSWDLVFKRYFNGQERDRFSEMTPNKRKEWTISRIAAKDAVRALVLRYKKEACYPIEFEILTDDRGRPFTAGPGMASVRLSLAHKGTDAVAVAAYGSPVGIDIESIETRDAEFLNAVFHPEELAMGAGEEPDVWATRCWVAKEAYGKSIGLGLQGDPKTYRIEEVRDDVLRIKDVVVKTIKYKNYIIGWTL
ncbi:MAG TPA: acyltransferase domain-containing protein, partial [Puia sp.]